MSKDKTNKEELFKAYEAGLDLGFTCITITDSMLRKKFE